MAGFVRATSRNRGAFVKSSARLTATPSRATGDGKPTGTAFSAPKGKISARSRKGDSLRPPTKAPVKNLRPGGLVSYSSRAR